MGILTQANADVVYNLGGADLMAVFAVRNVQSGDTLDLTILSFTPMFQFLRAATVFTKGGTQAQVAPTAGTVVTMPTNIPANSSGHLVVTGC